MPWPTLLDEGCETTGYFYGNNIHPEAEWRLRRNAVRVLAAETGCEAVVADYDPEVWMRATAGMADMPEGGARCGVCFALQLESAAAFAAANGFGRLCTTLTISPHKDPERLNAIGRSVAPRYGLGWIERIWRKNDGFKASVRRSRELGLYRQNYCGCVYSIGGTTARDERDQKGKEARSA